MRGIVPGIVVACMVAAACKGEEPAGQRPYEMVWAGRTEDTRPPLVDFEKLEGWRVETADSVATFQRSRKQPLWGEYAAQLVHRGGGPRPVVTIRPPKPIPLPKDFDCVNLWIFGNNWSWAPEPGTPQVEVAVLLRGKTGRQVRISLGRVLWKEWWLVHRRIAENELASLGDDAMLEGLEVIGGQNREDRTLYFDNLAFYREPLPPLKFEPRPERNLTLFPGQSHGTNTGPGRLPFPTREETLLPDNLTSKFDASLEQAGKDFAFHYRGDDGHLIYHYRPATGSLSDVTACWEGRCEAFRPVAEGGVALVSVADGKPVAPDKIEPIGCRREGNSVVSTWRYILGKSTAEVEYRLQLWQKSLVIDVICCGGRAGEFRIGKAIGASQPRLVTLPFLVCDNQRPAVLVMGPAEHPLFAFAILDYYRSNASELWAENRIAKDGVWYNGGARYLPKTDGVRNDCFERLFLTVSPRFEEVLPNIANPKSPWMEVAGERVWRAHGASNRQQDYATWKKVARYGMTKIALTDHETGWRDGGESFTFRTRAAPGKGGDEAQADYARKIRALGFRYGIYNNYTDFAPVNEHWHEDTVSRFSDGEWRTAWPRCYNPKPSRAVEYEAKLAPIIQKKFQLDTAYCDVHTAVRPWQYCDYDARVPGAGTFAATVYAYGEIMLHQKQTWNGPVYSEGNNHWYYCGLTDGNYGQDQAAQLDQRPWLVDFDLRKLHPLCCNFGMGNLGMFYGRGESLGSTAEEGEARLDRFLAATLAFGHTGFLVMEGGMEYAVRSYFSVQQVHAHYAQEAASEIRYADAQGNLLDTSEAVASGAYERSQVMTRYSNGLTVAVNGHPTETWRTQEVVLPPNGWIARGELKDGPLLALSALVEGRRVDYVDSPAYLYANGRGAPTRFEKAFCDGAMIAHKRADGVREVIPVGKCSSFAIAMDGRSATATALDEEGKAIGPAETRLSRGLVHVMPVSGAFSYVLTPASAPELTLSCDRSAVVPGEMVTVVGRAPHTFEVPDSAAPNQRFWQTFDGAWIDFTIRPVFDASLKLEPERLRLELISHLPKEDEVAIALAGQQRSAKIAPEKSLSLEFPHRRPTTEGVEPIELAATAGKLAYRRNWWLKSEDEMLVHEFPNEVEKGQCLRGQKDRPLDDTARAAVLWSERSCGGETRKCLFMHPPYVGGVGYAFAITPPLRLGRTRFCCDIGKADGSDPGDGILFRVAVIEPGGKETIVAEKPWINHAWTPLEADLSAWAGQEVRLKLVAEVGPRDNSSGDWACWSQMRFEDLRPTLVTVLHDRPTQLQRVPGPHHQQNLSVEDLRRAKAGRLHFQAIGLQAAGQYISHGSLNGVPIGSLPGAGGDELRGVWADASMALTSEAIASLAEWNCFAIRNPGGDCFKLGRAWIELELADGRKASSQMTNTIYTQPGNWKYAEGIGVSKEEAIKMTIRFKLEKRQ